MKELRIVLALVAAVLCLRLPAAGAGGCGVPDNTIISGGPPKDGIPSVDSPRFASSYTGSGGDYVIGVALNGEAKAYPIQILDWHEIVNDVVGGVSVSLTYCPLAASGMLHDRGSTTFGTSGMLYENNLIMYDRASDSLFVQMLNKGIEGSKACQVLPLLPLFETTASAWGRMYPNSKWMTTQTGYSRSYGRYPYGDYEQTDSTLFTTSFDDDREPYSMHSAKSRTLVVMAASDAGANITAPATVRLYPFPLLQTIGVASGGDIVVVFHPAVRLAVPFATPSTADIPGYTGDARWMTFTANAPGADGLRTITDDQTGSTWNWEGVCTAGALSGRRLRHVPAYNAFWFSATSIFPQAEICTGAGCGADPASGQQSELASHDPEVSYSTPWTLMYTVGVVGIALIALGGLYAVVKACKKSR